MPAVHAGLLALIDHGRRRSSHDEIMMWAERLLSLDHLAEEGIRAQMEAFALVGDRVSALRIFDEWKDRLLDDLGAQPSRMVEGMAAQLRKRGWQPSRAKPTPAVPAEQWRRTSFVGRRHEYQHLYEVWEGVHHYQAKHLLITGDSGVGKTTLAQRLVTAAGLEGASVSRVQCYHVEQRIPYAAVSSIILGLLDRPGVSSAAPTALAELARIIPQVRELFARLPEPERVEGESVRLLFAEAAVDLLRALLSERPVLVVIDDWIYADEVSRAVLHLITRRIDDRRFMVVATLRSDVGSDYQSAEHDLSSLVATRIALEPMPREDCLELLDVILPEGHPAPSSTERRALVAASRGYPMALELFAQDWVARGSNCMGLALRAFTTSYQSSRSGGADPFRELVARLLTDLTPCMRQCLYLASVLGPSLGDLALYAILDLTISQTMESLAQLTDRRILRDVGSGTEFMNELVRAHVYGSIPASLRKQLHGLVANQLLVQTDPARCDQHLEIAWHLIRSHRGSDALPYLKSGSDYALLRGAPDEVILALESYLRDAPPKDDAASAAMSVTLVEALHETARWEDGLRIAAQHEATSLAPTFRILAIEAQWRMGNLSRSEQEALVHELLTYSRLPSADFFDRALLLAAFISGDLKDESLMDQVRVTIPTTDGAPRLENATLLTAAAALAFHSRRLREGEVAARKAREILERLGVTNAARARLELGIGAFQAAQGEYEGSLGSFRSAIALAGRIDNRSLIGTSTGNLCLTLFRLGHYREVISAARSVPGDSDPVARCNAIYAECGAYVALGEPGKALDRVGDGDTIASEAQRDWLIQKWQLNKLDILWLAGWRNKSLSEARSIVGTAANYPLAKGTTGNFLRWQAKLVDKFISREDFARIVGEEYHQRAALDALDRYELLQVIKAGGFAMLGCDQNLDDELHEL
ncbi:MAG: ATP-binding protein, partial [Gemmatimonadales bacterium]